MELVLPSRTPWPHPQVTMQALRSLITSSSQSAEVPEKEGWKEGKCMFLSHLFHKMLCDACSVFNKYSPN